MTMAIAGIDELELEASVGGIPNRWPAVGLAVGALVRTTLGQVKRVAHAHRATVNDVLLAVTAGDLHALGVATPIAEGVRS
jgi:hypothetical protein